MYTAAVVALLFAPQVPQVSQVEPVLVREIGSADGTLDDAFVGVIDLAADEDGNLYILDDRADRVRAFAPSGDHLRSFGRRGGDPGQLNRPMRLDVRNGIVTVLNPSGQAVSFTLAGDVVASDPLPRGTQSASRIDEGTYVLLSSGGIARERPAPIESLLLVGPEAEDTAFTVPSSDILYRSPAATASVRTSLCRMAHFVVATDGTLWVASGIEGRLTDWGRIGGPLAPGRSVEVAAPGGPLPDTARAREFARLPSQLDPATGELYVPLIQSSVCGLERSTDGTLWVRLNDVEGRERWTAVDAEAGAAIRELVAPEGVTISAFAGSLAFGIGRDDSGAPTVMMYRLE